MDSNISTLLVTPSYAFLRDLRVEEKHDELVVEQINPSRLVNRSLKFCYTSNPEVNWEQVDRLADRYWHTARTS